MLGAVEVRHSRYRDALEWGGGVSRLPLTKGPVPKPKGHHTGNEAHEIGIEYSAEALHGDAIFRNHHPGDRPVDGYELDGDQVGDHRSHRSRQRG